MNFFNWFKKKKSEQAFTFKKFLQGPFHDISEFEVGDLVTTKPDVSPGGRTNVPVSEVGPMMIHGQIAPAVRVMGLPYYADELIIVKKRAVIKESIPGLWR